MGCSHRGRAASVVLREIMSENAEELGETRLKESIACRHVYLRRIGGDTGKGFNLRGSFEVGMVTINVGFLD